MGYKYNDRVTVVSGFYSGKTGLLKEESVIQTLPSTTKYLISFDDGDLVRWVSEEKLQAIDTPVPVNITFDNEDEKLARFYE